MFNTLPIDAILFDLDGTLLDTAPDIAAALNQALSECGMPPLSSTLVATLIGKGAPVLVERALTMLGVQRRPNVHAYVLARFEALYRNLPVQAAKLYPGVERGLEMFRERGIKMAIVSNTHHRFAVSLLQEFRLSHFFDIVVGGDSLPQNKPDPAPLLFACDALSVHPQRSLFVGDSSVDAQAADAANIPMVWVTYGYNNGFPISSMACLSQIADISELPELTSGWGRDGTLPSNRIAIY